MFRIVLKILALILIYQLVVKPLALGLAGRTVAILTFFEKTYWWMSPQDSGWK